MKRASQQLGFFFKKDVLVAYQGGELASDQFTRAGMKTSRQFADTS